MPANRAPTFGVDLVATLNPLVDPVSSSEAEFQPQPTAGEPPNLLLAIVRRWPWLLLGLAVGLVLGLLYHMQKSPVYQSSAELMVVKNRPDMISGSAGDSRVQYVEDYVGPQVIVMASDTILRLAAEKRLDEQKPFEAPPPEGIEERIAFMRSRFSVIREKEPGSNVPSNVLLLSFRAPHPADAPKYLKAIITAYKNELSGVFDEATTRNLIQLDETIKRIESSQKETSKKLRDAGQKLHGEVDPETNKNLLPGISQEDPARVQQRVSSNREAQTALELRRIVIDKELNQVRDAGNARAERLAVMARLGVSPERPSLFGDPRDPESMLLQLRYKKEELSNRLGTGHPEMVSLTTQIKALETEVEKRGGPVEDELERYRRKLENELAGIAAQLGVLAEKIDSDEFTMRRMAPLLQAIRTYEETLRSLATELETTIRERDRVRGTRTSGGFEVRDISKPSDGAQVAPVLSRSLILGSLLGMMMGAGLGLWSELSDRSFRSPADIRRRLGLSILGHVPLIRTNEPAEITPEVAVDPVLAVYLRPTSAEAEAVRAIRTQLLFSTKNRDHQVIQITSPNGGDGKSTVTANLAVALAKANKRVVLVDCDFRKPRVHRIFAIPNPEVGLASVVADVADLGDAVRTSEIENLSLLPCGPRPANPAELLTSPRFKEILADLRSSYDYVLLDTPPVLAVSDPAAVASRADGVILVFRMTADAGPNAERAKEELMAVSARILGVVVNASSERDMGYGYGYNYKYEYKYSDSYTD